MAFIAYWNKDNINISALLPKKDFFIYEHKNKKIYFLLQQMDWFYIL